MGLSYWRCVRAGQIHRHLPEIDIGADDLAMDQGMECMT